MLGGGRRVLAQSVDENRRRSALPHERYMHCHPDTCIAAAPSTETSGLTSWVILFLYCDGTVRCTLRQPQAMYG